MSESIKVLQDAGVLSLLLARPEKKNALTDAMYAVLADAVERAQRDATVHCVLISAQGADFCAGNDIGDFIALGASGRPLADLHVTRLLAGLAVLQKPLVAAVCGRAVGIGMTLLLHCDLVYLGESARLSAPFVNLGLVPEAGSSTLLPQRLGHVLAFEVFALGKELAAAEALSAGIANAVVADEEAMRLAAAAAHSLAARPPQALQATKRLMRDGAELAALMQAELGEFARRLQSVEAQRIFAAFAARRGQVRDQAPSTLAGPL